MLRRALMSVVFLGFGSILLVSILPDIVPLSETARTEDATDSGLTCTTGSGETSCEVSLTDTHEYIDTTQMTVTETSPGAQDRTSDTTVGSDRQTLTISSLSASTTYEFDVDYSVRDNNVSPRLNDVLRSLPAVLIFGVFIIAVVASIRGIGAFTGG